MKRIIVVSFLAVAFLFASVPVFAETVTLTYSNFFPPTHIQSKVAEEWCKEIEKRTNGALKIEYYPGGTLTKAKQCYDGVVEGLSDIGLSVLAYSRGRFPVMAAVDLPLGYTSGVVATQVANKVYDKFNPKEFDDVKVMYFHAHGPGLVHTAKKPVKKMEDMQGLKLRATGNSAKVVKALGGTPVAMSMPDSYQSIQKGVVDGGVYPVETNKGWKMGEVVDYCTEAFSAAYTTTFFVVMNKQKWESLSPEVQKVVAEVNKEWIDKHAKAWDESDIEGRKFFLEQGNEFITLDEAEMARWGKAVEPILDEYVKEVEEKGVNGREIVDFTVQAVKESQ